MGSHAVTVASGGIASGALASGSVASGAIASGAVASGAVASGAFASGSISAGAVAAGATSFVKLEDVASADADAGVPALAVRKASPANTSGTDGDYEFLQISAGRLWVSAVIDTALPAGSAVIGHVITDTGSTTAVTGTVTISGAVTEATLDAALISQEATTSGIKGLTMFGAVTTAKPTYTTAKSDALSLDVNGLLRVSLADTPVNGTALSVNATLSAETTKVIGVTRTADGAGNLLTTNSTTFTAKFGLDANLLGTLGTAFSTAGKVDVKAADGDVFVRQATGSNLHMVLDSGTLTTLTTLTGITNTVVTDDLAAAPTGSAVPANAHYQGLIAKTALPAAGSDGNLTGAMSDKFGRQVVVPGAIRDLVGTQTTTISASTAETTIATQVASTFLDLTVIMVSNTSATPTRVDFRDTTAGSVLFSIYVPAGDVRGVSFARPIPQTSVNTNWTAQSSASVTDLRVYVAFDKNK